MSAVPIAASAAYTDYVRARFTMAVIPNANGFSSLLGVCFPIIVEFTDFGHYPPEPRTITLHIDSTGKVTENDTTILCWSALFYVTYQNKVQLVIKNHGLRSTINSSDLWLHEWHSSNVPVGPGSVFVDINETNQLQVVYKKSAHRCFQTTTSG